MSKIRANPACHTQLKAARRKVCLHLNGNPPASRPENWWSLSGSNRRPQACKASALPTELRPQTQTPQTNASIHPKGHTQGTNGRSSQTARMVGRARVELATSRLSGVRSNHLSYRPIPAAQRAAKRPTQAAAQQARRPKAPHQPCWFP